MYASESYCFSRPLIEAIPARDTRPSPYRGRSCLRSALGEPSGEFVTLSSAPTKPSVAWNAYRQDAVAHTSANAVPCVRWVFAGSASSQRWVFAVPPVKGFCS